MAEILDKLRGLRKKNISLLGYYHQLQKKDPKKKYFVPLAEAYRSLEYFDEAVQTLQEGLKWHPGYYVGRALLAQTYYQMGLFLQASLEAERVICIDSNNLLGLRILTKAYLKLGEIKKIKEPLGQLLKLIPGDKEALQIEASLVSSLDKKGGISKQSSQIGDFQIFSLQKTSQKVMFKKIDILNRLLVKIQSKMGVQHEA